MTFNVTSFVVVKRIRGTRRDSSCTANNTRRSLTPWWEEREEELPTCEGQGQRPQTTNFPRMASTSFASSSPLTFGRVQKRRAFECSSGEFPAADQMDCSVGHSAKRRRKGDGCGSVSFQAKENWNVSPFIQTASIAASAVGKILRVGRWTGFEGILSRTSNMRLLKRPVPGNPRDY